MYCPNCGKDVDDRLDLCGYCGHYLGDFKSEGYSSDGNGIAIVGFIFSFFFPIIGLICSYIGAKNAEENGAPYGGLAVAGIAISCVFMASLLFMFCTHCAL